MKKILLVIGFATYSIFGFSQFYNVPKKGMFLEKDIPNVGIINYVSHPHDSVSWSQGIQSLTTDKKYLYASSYSPWGTIYKINPENLKVIKKIKYKLPGKEERIKKKKSSMLQLHKHLMHDKNNLFIGCSSREKIYKINKKTGDIIDSIPGPPTPERQQFYGGICYYGGYYWVIRNDYNYGTMIFKLSKYGYIVDKYDLSFFPRCDGISIENGRVWVNEKRNGVTTMIQFSYLDLINKKFPLVCRRWDVSEDTFGAVNSIVEIDNNYYFHTGNAHHTGGLLIHSKFVQNKK